MFPSNKYKYDAKLEVEVKNSCGISKIQTLREYKDLKIETNEKVSNISYSFDTLEDFSHDFVFIVQPKEAFKPMALVEKNEENNSLAVLLNYYPSWDDIDVDLFEPKTEIIFVVDRVKKKIFFNSFFFLI